MTMLHVTSAVEPNGCGGDPATDPPNSLRCKPAPPLWVDLSGPDRTQLAEAQQALGLSPEVATACLRRARAMTVSTGDSTLFLVTFVARRAAGGLFGVHALKICVTPRGLLTVHGRASAAPRVRSPFRPDVREAPVSQTGQLLRLLLEEVVRSYEAVGTDLTRRLRAAQPADGPSHRVAQLLSQQMRKRGTQLVRLLTHQRAFLQQVEQVGRTLFTADDRTRLQWLAERVGVLARRMGELVRRPWEGRQGGEPARQVILTAQEKQTALSGQQLACRHFTAVDLAGAVFRATDLEGTKFVRSNLRRADFRQANLRGTVFSFCDLWDATFTGAQLERANFCSSFGLAPAMWGYIRSHGGVV
jgi:Mg2+ and Co2+ transporter CorA